MPSSLRWQLANLGLSKLCRDRALFGHRLVLKQFLIVSRSHIPQRYDNLSDCFFLGLPLVWQRLIAEQAK